MSTWRARPAGVMTTGNRCGWTTRPRARSMAAWTSPGTVGLRWDARMKREHITVLHPADVERWRGERPQNTGLPKMTQMTLEALKQSRDEVRRQSNNNKNCYKKI